MFSDLNEAHTDKEVASAEARLMKAVIKRIRRFGTKSASYTVQTVCNEIIEDIQKIKK